MQIFFLIWTVTVLTFFSGTAMAGNKCDADNIQKSLVSKDASNVRFVLDNCTVSKQQLNPVSSGKGIYKPVILAALNGSVQIMEMLAKAGADINVKGGGTTGDTPLIIAVMKGNHELVEFLVTMGADVNKVNNFGASPFWGACAGGSIEYVKLFIENGARINQSGRFPDPLKKHKGIITGITPLMAATYSGNQNVVSLLFQEKADTTLKDSVGRTAADYAVGAKQTGIAKLLRNEASSEGSTLAPKQPDSDQDGPVAQAIRKSIALAVSKGASDNLRIEQFIGTIINESYLKWDFSLRDSATIYRVRFDSKNKTQVFKRNDKRGAVQDYWSTVEPANSIVELDTLVVAARQKAIEAGFTPTDYTYIKYRMAGPRAPKIASQEIMEVFFEIAGEENARCIVFHDRQFQRLTPAKIMKIRIPSPRLPQPKIPTVNLIPEVKIPEITDPNIRVQENEQLVVITLWSDILFDFDKWNIRPDAEEALGQVLKVLSIRYAKLPFELHGHTDSKGTEAYNLNLSRRRANSVKDWLNTNGITKERISIYPHGELQPIEPNSNADGSDNPQGRQKNRRVEIHILK